MAYFDPRHGHVLALSLLLTELLDNAPQGGCLIDN